MKIPVYKRNRAKHFFCPAAHSALGLKDRRVGCRTLDWWLNTNLQKTEQRIKNYCFMWLPVSLPFHLKLSILN